MGFANCMGLGFIVLAVSTVFSCFWPHVSLYKTPTDFAIGAIVLSIGVAMVCYNGK